jgi:hypothetical protein
MISGVTKDLVLSPAETLAAEFLVTRAWDTGVQVRVAEEIWGRSHIVRVRFDGDRSAVLKRRREQHIGKRIRGFDAELVALEFLNSMPTAVAPRLLGADTEAGILVMEDLGPGGSLAHSLLGVDRSRAADDLVAYARALASMHAWSIARAGEFSDIRARRAPEVVTTPHWTDHMDSGRAALRNAAADLGLGAAADDASSEIDSLRDLISGGSYSGLVHSDACPDNTHIVNGDCRIFDFETSGWGSVTLDAAYLLAPFPSCWCFAQLPSDIVAPAMLAYRSSMSSAGIDMGPDWEAAMAAALASLVLGRGTALAHALDEDREWGTTSVRPRLLTWLRSFLAFGGSADILPKFHVLAQAMHERLCARWASVVVPDYPALARPGAELAKVPLAWDSD